MTPSAEPAFRIRRYEPGDEDAVYHVCLKTGDAGEDATELFDDPKALGHIYVGPYMRLEPELAFVLVDAEGVCGYVLGALDTERFNRRYAEEWLPELQRRHPRPEGDPSRWTPTQWIYNQYHSPDLFFPEELRPYPSHLHIDLLPRAQGKGQGKLMMARLLDELKRAGSTGVHLALAATNQRAEQFYRKLGFTELLRRGSPELDAIYMGKLL